MNLYPLFVSAAVFLLLMGIGTGIVYLRVFGVEKRDLILAAVVALIVAGAINLGNSNLLGWIDLVIGFGLGWYYIRPALKAGIWPLTPIPTDEEK